METKLKQPHELLTICKVRENELAAFLKRAIAIELFRESLISIGKTSEIVEVSRNEMMDLLGERRNPLHYRGCPIIRYFANLNAYFWL